MVFIPQNIIDVNECEIVTIGVIVLVTIFNDRVVNRNPGRKVMSKSPWMIVGGGDIEQLTHSDEPPQFYLFTTPLFDG